MGTFLKKQPIIQNYLPNCPSCKQNKWLEFDKGYYCKNCEYIINIQKHQIDKKVLKVDRDFSTILNYANKKIREIWMKLVYTKYISTEHMIIKLQQLKGNTKLKFYKNISNFYDNMSTGFDEGPFAKIAQGNSKIYHEVPLLMKFSQIKPQVRNTNINCYGLYYTVIRIRDENKDVDNKYENAFLSLKDVIIPNHFVGIKK